MEMIDTHAHLDGEEFNEDLSEVVERALKAGVNKVFLPAINLSSVTTIEAVCRRYPDFAYPMIGLHPEEVKEDWEEVLTMMRGKLLENLTNTTDRTFKYIAVGEVGLDFYWSKTYRQEQLSAFEEQVKWSVETR